MDDPETPTSCQIALRFPEREHVTELRNDSWHTDGERKSRRHPFTLLVGVCLSDCVSSLNRGTLCVWPRQHLNPRLAERPDIGKPVQVPMRCGDVVLCHSELPHCGAPNRSCDIRYMIYFRVRHRFMKRLLEESPLDPFADLTLLQRPRFRVLSANDLNVFRSDGVLVVRNVISKEEASILRERFVQSLGIDKAPERLDRLSSTHTGVLDVFYSEWKLYLTMTCRRYADAYADLLEHTYGTNRGLYEHPFEDFDASKSLIHIDRIGYRVPSSDSKVKQRSLTPHLDCAPEHMYECVGKAFPRWRPIQCLLSLSDTGQNKNEGGFEACLGFHRQFRAYFESKSKVRSVSDYTAVRDKSLRMEHVSLSAGDAVFWDQRVIHANAVCNVSKRPRVCVYGGFLPRTKRNLEYAVEQLRRARARLTQSDFWVGEDGASDTITKKDEDDPIRVLLEEQAKDDEERRLIMMRLGIVG